MWKQLAAIRMLTKKQTKKRDSNAQNPIRLNDLWLGTFRTWMWALIDLYRYTDSILKYTRLKKQCLYVFNFWFDETFHCLICHLAHRNRYCNVFNLIKPSCADYEAASSGCNSWRGLLWAVTVVVMNLVLECQLTPCFNVQTKLSLA